MSDGSVGAAEDAYAAAVAATNRGDDEEGFRLFALAEELGDERARLSNAALAAYNAGDESTAEQLWFAGAELGCARCLFNLGQNARWDWQDLAEAERFFTQAADAGYATAALEVAYMLAPEGQIADLHWLQCAIDAGLPDAMNTRGVIAQRSGDEQEASAWYERAAAGGFPLGITNLARCAERAGHSSRAYELHVQAVRAGSEFSVRHMLKEADADGVAQVLQLAVDAGMEQYARLPSLWASHRRAEDLAQDMDPTGLLEAGRKALDMQDLAAAHVYLAGAIVGGLDGNEERSALLALVSEVLMPLGRTVEAEVWALRRTGDPRFTELAEQSHRLQSESIHVKDVVRLPENSSWQDAVVTLQWWPTDRQQTRYDEVIAFAAGGGFGEIDCMEDDAIRVSEWLHNLMAGPVRFKFQPDSEVFVAALADFARFIGYSNDESEQEEAASVPVSTSPKKQRRMNIFGE